MKINDLRIGNIITYFQPLKQYPIYDKIKSIYFEDDFNNYYIELDSGRYCGGGINIGGLIPVMLDKDILKRCGFSPLKTFNVCNSLIIDIGRDRFLSIGNVGTPNEMLWLETIENNHVKDIICLHNYDYDGRLTLHKLQNIYFDLTHNELDVRYLLTLND